MFTQYSVANTVTSLQSFTLMMASAQVVETSVNTNNSPSQDYTTHPDDHSNHNSKYCLIHVHTIQSNKSFQSKPLTEVLMKRDITTILVFTFIWVGGTYSRGELISFLDF